MSLGENYENGTRKKMSVNIKTGKLKKISVQSAKYKQKGRK
jgi:hypothetical protein